MDHEEDRERSISCPSCGARNPATAACCASCGVPLGAPPIHTRVETVIDISTGQPRVVGSDEETDQAGRIERVPTIRFDQGRAIFVQGGRWTCLAVLLVALVLVCCVCLGLWQGIAVVF